MSDGQKTKQPVGRPYAVRLLRVLLAALLFILCVHLFLQFLNLNVFHQQNGQFYELSNRFDLDDESSVSTWFSQALFLAIGVFAALAAYLQKAKAPRRLWGLIATLGLLLSIDEIASLHEHVLQSLHVIFFKDAAPEGLANAWLLVTPFVLLAAGWLAWTMARLVPKRTMKLFVISGGIFLVGAIGIDLLTSVAYRENFLNQGILVGAEETLELLGVVFILYAIADYLEVNYRASLCAAAKQLKSGRSAKA